MKAPWIRERRHTETFTAYGVEDNGRTFVQDHILPYGLHREQVRHLITTARLWEEGSVLVKAISDEHCYEYGTQPKGRRPLGNDII